MSESPASESPAHTPIHPGTRIGHVHLKVANLDRALGFWRDVIGLEEQQRYGDQAVFLSAGGYHHHMAMNAWASRGVGLRAPELGLGRVDISVPDADALAQTAERLRGGGVQYADTGATLEVDDPWGNRIRLAAA